MTELKQYILRVMAAAIICAIVHTILPNKNGYSSLTKLITGVFLALTVILPWKQFRFDTITQHIDDISGTAMAAAEIGINSARDATLDIIKSKTEAYILDKAVSMGLDVEVEVTLDSSDPPLPEKVTIKGAVSPYAREKLSKCIANDLAIPEDEQIWI